MREIIIKKCLKCGAIVKVIDDCKCNDCGINCCNEKMVYLKENSFDASYEKHVPNYEIDGDKLIVQVNHVMDDDHFIEWVAFVNEFREEFVYFKPKSLAKATFKNEKGTIYAYCSKHGIWSKKVD